MDGEPPPPVALVAGHARADRRPKLARELFGSGWPHLSLDTLWHAIGGVARHLSNPRQGFPARARPGLRGPAGFYAALALLVVVLEVVTAAAIRVWERHRSTGIGGSKKHGARWAGGRELRRLRRTRRTRGRQASKAAAAGVPPRAEVLGLSLGYRGMRLLRAEDRHALLVFGPT
ncbi:MAG: hypothetical protein ABSG43_27125 [Solirubrobacteraceae bacterium]|jgi:hypothetical protein